MKPKRQTTTTVSTHKFECPPADIPKFPVLPDLNVTGLQQNHLLTYIQSCAVTDTQAAKLTAILLKNKVLFCAKEKMWYLWDGKRWDQDHTKRIILLFQAAVKHLIGMTSFLEFNTDRQKKFYEKFHACENMKTMTGVMELLKADLPTLPQNFNKNLNAINLLNGTLNLQTMKMSPHRPSNFCSQLANVSYDVDACDVPFLWLETLDKYFLSSQPLIRYFQKVLGLSLCGEQLEHVFFLLHGKGENGKSTLLNVLGEILGDYCGSVPVETFLSSKADGNRFSTGQLVGKRLVFCIEPDRGKYLKEGMIKALTGGDSVVVENKFQTPFTIKPQCTIFLACNEEPKISGTDRGIWRRIKKIPFKYTVKKSEKVACFEKRLLEEREGIFAWIVEGWKRYLKEGLKEPNEIKAQIDTYRQHEDITLRFVKESCTKDVDASVQSSKLYEAFVAWAKLNSEKVLTQTMFSRRLTGHGFRKRHTMNGWFWEGINIFS